MPTVEVDETLLARLCSLEHRVVFFPVRHHSPTAAFLVQKACEQLAPERVLIEGPSDFNPNLQELTRDHKPPIAIYSYFADESGGRHGAYYPFCEYSPEWAALRQAHRQGVRFRFIDLPWIEVARLDLRAHRYADAELRRARYVRAVCQQMEVEDFDDLWDKVIEADFEITLEDYLQRCHTLCYHARLWERTIPPADQMREAHMAEQIRRALRACRGRVLVVTGGFHSPALAMHLEGLVEHAPDGSDRQIPQTDDLPARSIEIAHRGITLTPYSYERLDSLTGYEAGMPSPGFYDHVWQARQGGVYRHEPLVEDIAVQLRQRKQVVSTADLIAVETTSQALAALRGRSHVWRRDLLDGVTAALIKDEVEYGCESPFLEAVLATLRGDRRGRLSAGTRRTPLFEDVVARLEQLGLSPGHQRQEVTLDLLNSADQGKSRVLHRMAVLSIAGFRRTGGTDFASRIDLARLWETWEIVWTPEFDATCIEASRFGVSLEEAVTNRLTEASAGADRSAAIAARLLLQAAQAGIGVLRGSLLQRLESLILEDAEFLSVTRALRQILYLYSFDEALGTAGTESLSALLQQTFDRSLWLLEHLGSVSGQEADALAALETLQETFRRSAESAEMDFDDFVSVLQRVERDAQQHATVRGAVVGMLWTLDAARPDDVLANLLLLSQATQLGDFLTGLFSLARELVQRESLLIQQIDTLLMAFSAEEFQEALPAVRLAFTYFTPREKHHMLKTLFDSLGMTSPTPLRELDVDPETAASVLVWEQQLYEALARYGIRGHAAGHDTSEQGGAQ